MNVGPNPLGGHYVGSQPGRESLAQIYASERDLGIQLYEGVFGSLAAADYPIWKDYLSDPEARLGPPGENAFWVVSGTILHLEIDTFVVNSLVHEAARAVIMFAVVQNADEPPRCGRSM